MDEHHLARLVDEVERAFPGDPAAQRDAWEFLEAFMDAWDEAGAADAATAVAGATDDRPSAVRRLLAVCRELLRDAAGRVVTVVDELVPAEAAVVLADPDDSTTVTIAVEADIATELGIAPEITVDVSSTYVTLNATTVESSNPERLAAVLQVSDGPDGVLVGFFARVDPTLAAVSFDIADAVLPLGLALVVIDPDGR